MEEFIGGKEQQTLGLNFSFPLSFLPRNGSTGVTLLELRATSDILHLFSSKTNLLSHFKSSLSISDAWFAVTVRERTVLFVSFEIRSHSVIFTEGARRFTFPS